MMGGRLALGAFGRSRGFPYLPNCFVMDELGCMG